VSVVRGEDGAPRAREPRIETFCGKPVRGKANVPLEYAMDDVINAALAWATEHPDWSLPEQARTEEQSASPAP
jgi:hypothetical protein